jgi:external thioesterase TEII
MDEQLLQDFGKAAQDIFGQVSEKLNGQAFLVYGHSMGAYLALRLVNMLEKNGQQAACLLVSGNAGPGIEYDHKKRYLLPREAFIEELKMLGGVPDELFQDEELFQLFEPVLRADFEIAEENGLAKEPPVSCPLFAMMGSTEEKTGQIDNWGKFTRARFDFEILSGGHFFIYDHAGRIAGIINNWYRDSRTVTI